MIIKTNGKKIIKCLESIKNVEGGYSVWGVRWIKNKGTWSNNKSFHWFERYKPFDFSKDDMDSPF